MKKIIAIIQARLDSTRLPRKALINILGKPLIIHLLERVKESKKIDDIIAATTDRKVDDELVKVLKNQGVKVFRGSNKDVLDRYYQAATKYCADVIVRVTGDCPLIDPNIIDLIIQHYLDNDFDYVTNIIVPTYPDGLDVEIFSYETLKKTWEESKLLSEREHVTPYIKKHPEIFRLNNFKNSVDWSHLRWTVDQKEDLKFVIEIYKRLYNKKPLFLMKDILQILDEEPELKEINSRIQRDEGYLKSLKEDDNVV